VPDAFSRVTETISAKFEPAKNPVPLTETVTGAELEPLLGVIEATEGAGVETVNLVEDTAFAVDQVDTNTL